MRHGARRNACRGRKDVERAVALRRPRARGRPSPWLYWSRSWTWSRSSGCRCF